MAYEQVEHLVRVDQHVVTLKDSKTKWDGTWLNDPFGEEKGIGVAEGVVSIVDFSRAAGNAPLLVEIHSEAPATDDFDDYEGVLEASIRLPSGKLSIENEDGIAAAVSVPKVAGAAWRLRMYYANGDTARCDYSDGGEHVRIVLYPAPSAPAVVLKPRELDGDIVREYRGKRSEAELLEMLAGPNLSHKCLAAVALLQIGSVEPVQAAASKKDAVRRVYASTVWFAGAPAEEVLATLARDADPDIRTRAAQSIGFLEAKALEPILKKLTKDREEAVREAAESALEAW